MLLSGWQTRRDPLAGALLCWRDGQWSLDLGEGERAVEVLSGSVSLPWLVCLSWRDMTNGRVGRLWLFVDSVEAGGQRRLRLRLTLER